MEDWGTGAEGGMSSEVVGDGGYAEERGGLNAEERRVGCGEGGY